MNTAKLNDLIAEENDRREEQALRSAQSLINEIVKNQQSITEAQKRIAECRDELKALEVAQLNATEVLGE